MFSTLELLSSEDDLWAVGSWEANDCGHWSNSVVGVALFRNDNLLGTGSLWPTNYQTGGSQKDAFCGPKRFPVI